VIAGGYKAHPSDPLSRGKAFLKNAALTWSRFLAENRIPPPPEFIIGPAFGRTRWRGQAFPENVSLTWQHFLTENRIPLFLKML
jgi:hypothetical protein